MRVDDLMGSKIEWNQSLKCIDGTIKLKQNDLSFRRFTFSFKFNATHWP